MGASPFDVINVSRAGYVIIPVELAEVFVEYSIIVPVLLVIVAVGRLSS
jgi:hypothetical protein